MRVWVVMDWEDVVDVFSNEEAAKARAKEPDDGGTPYGVYPFDVKDSWPEEGERE